MLPVTAICSASSFSQSPESSCYTGKYLYATYHHELDVALTVNFVKSTSPLYDYKLIVHSGVDVPLEGEGMQELYGKIIAVKIYISRDSTSFNLKKPQGVFGEPYLYITDPTILLFPFSGDTLPLMDLYAPGNPDFMIDDGLNPAGTDEWAVENQAGSINGPGDYPPDADDDIDYDNVYIEDQLVFPDVMASFPGGGEALKKFFSDNLIYPDQAKEMGITGRVYIRLVVNTDGTLEDIRVIKPAHYLLDQEALRVAKLMPDWIPGTLNGKNVRSECTFPVNFTLQ